MRSRLVKLLYFATICLPPPLLLFLYPAIFLWRLPVPSEILMAYAIYFWIGFVILLVDLWWSRRDQDAKIVWTGLLVLLGIVTLPIYWFRHVLRGYKTV